MSKYYQTTFLNDDLFVRESQFLDQKSVQVFVENSG